MEFAIEVEGLTSIEVNADAIELALEVDTMMVLNIISISSIATSSKLFDVIVLLVCWCFFSVLSLVLASTISA